MEKEFPNSDVKVLQGHTEEVIACTWNPTGSLLATGSGDSTARIWTIDVPSSSSSSSSSSGSSSTGPLSVVLRHSRGGVNEQLKDVISVEWNVEGTRLATGCSDGKARIWNKDGQLVTVLSGHRGLIFSLKWNKKCDYLLTGSNDRTAIVWNVKTSRWLQRFPFHSAGVLDVDWRNNDSFATCSVDRTIHFCRINSNRPIKTFVGHQNKVINIKWDPTGTRLASCSNDRTAKIWSIKQSNCLVDFKEHSKEVYTLRWSPTGPGTNNPNLPLFLATASFDSTVKLWDVEAARLLHNLHGHRDHVYSIAFSPNGEYLASGSLDKCMHVWSVKEGRIVRTFTGADRVFDVSWNREGNKIAAGLSNNAVCVIDFRM